MLASQIFALLNQLLSVYYYLLIARIILYWIVNSYTLENHFLGYWLCLVTDPFLRFFRRLPFTVIGGIIDLSPIFALFSISLLQRFIGSLRATQSAPFGVVFLSMVFQFLTFIVSMVQTLLIVCALLLFFRLCSALFSNKYNLAISHIDVWIGKLINGPLSFLNMQRSKITMQITALLAITSLAIYLLSLATLWLNGLLLSVLTRI